jgi:hypothetical protein
MYCLASVTLFLNSWKRLDGNRTPYLLLTIRPNDLFLNLSFQLYSRLTRSRSGNSQVAFCPSHFATDIRIKWQVATAASWSLDSYCIVFAESYLKTLFIVSDVIVLETAVPKQLSKDWEFSSEYPVLLE